jgi:formate hydrogenlyase transcriptional activator
MILKAFDVSERPEYSSTTVSAAEQPSSDKILFMNHQNQKPPRAHDIIGESRALKSVLQQVEMVAPTDSTVLIQGETGTGKELIARSVHNASSRRNGPFITLNCAAIPAALIESELFGYERGAFTGAMTQRIGRFEAANGGTLFLDEIGEIALDLQVKLLRVLQEQEFERLGSTRTTKVNVRVVAATNRDLPQMIEEKQFRADLFYRLSVFPIHVPALRERREDIPALVHHFMLKYSQRMNKVVDEVPSKTMDAMTSYDWPGNIRQLQNFVEHGVIISRGAAFQPALEQLENKKTSLPKTRKTLDEAVREHILQALEQTRWVVGGRRGTAAYLGVARTTLLAKMRRLGIESRREGLANPGVERQAAFAAMA